MTESPHPEALFKRYLMQVREMYGEGVYIDDTFLKEQHSVPGDLAAFEAEICHCQECPLGQTRTNFVFGVGNDDADLLFVGEAPGRDEDLQGEPFVGKAGRLLDRILAAVNMTRDEVYICNVLKCRPPSNRTPARSEIETCFPYLERQIELVRPKLIVALGGTAAKTLLASASSLARLRSRVWNWKGYDVVVTYHPAALLRNPRLKRPAWEDFQWIERMVKGE